jgi:hypothetical protein
VPAELAAIDPMPDTASRQDSFCSELRLHNRRVSSPQRLPRRAERSGKRSTQGLELELVVLFDYQPKIGKKKYQIERNKESDETQCDDYK